MKPAPLLLIAMLVTGVSAWGDENIQAPPPPEAAKLGDPAASLDGLTYLKGGPVSLDDGRILVVEFWATWCGPCIASIPHLTEIQKQFKEKGVTVIGISGEKDLEKVKDFVAKKGEIMDYTVAIDPEGTVNAGYMKAYKQRGIPTAFIVNRKGAVVWVGHPAGELDKVLEEVLAGTFAPEAHAIVQAEREAASRKLGILFYKYRTALERGATIEESRPIAEKIIASADPRTLSDLAQRILSKPDVDDASRDMETALKAAAKANAATGGKNPAILSTYALALSKNSKLTEAVAAQEKAVSLTVGNERKQAAMKTRLDALKESLEKEAAAAE